MVYVIWGGEGGGNDVLLSEVSNGVKGFSVTGEQGYYTGLSISGLGDVNGDGMSDLVRELTNTSANPSSFRLSAPATAKPKKVAAG